MSTSGKIGVKGLSTAANWLALKPGQLIEASNCVIPSRDVIQPRRGQMLQSEYAAGVNGYIDGDSTDANQYRAKELYQWGDALMVHYGNANGSKLASFASFGTGPNRTLVGSYAEPDSTRLRMKFAQLAQSLYWTSTTGLNTLDVVSGTARAAGFLDPVIYLADGVPTYTCLTGNVNATGSWLVKNSAVAYRAVYGRKDANGVVHQSRASGRIVVVNPNDVVVAIGSLSRAANVVTATVTSHKFRVGDKLSLTLTGGDVGNFATSNNVVTSVTSTTIVWAETAANYVNVAAVTITSGTKSVQVAISYNNTATLTAGDIIQLYRTEEAASETIDPADECFLAYERVITSTDVSNGYVTITDNTPKDFLGDPLDSNANSGDGPLGVNERPPLCKDLCVWDGRLWGGQATDRHRLTVRLLGTGSPNGLQSGDLLAINTRVFEAAANFGIYTQYLPTENVERTTYDMATYMPASLIGGIAGRQEHDGNTGLGEIVFEQYTLGSTLADGSGGTIGAIYAATSRASAFADPLATTKAVTSANTSRTSNVITVRCVGHGFSIGQTVMLAKSVTGSVDANFPLGLKTITSVVDANNFQYYESGSNATLGGTSTHYCYAITYKSDDNRQPIRFSRPGIPEAWPLPNTLGGLPDGADVLRVSPSGSGYSLIVFLKDGDIYRVSGEYPYTVRKLDGTATLVAGDSLVSHSGKLHALTTQGVVTITEAGVGVVGGEIEDETRLLVSRIEAGTISAAVPFGTSYESDRQYLLSIPQQVALHQGVMSSTVKQALSFQSMLGEFTRPIWERTCGIVFRGRDLLVMGDSNTNQLRIERKDFSYTDYADKTVTLTVNGTQSNVSTVALAASSGLSAGDAVSIAATKYRVTAVGSTSITIDGTVSVANGDTFTGYVAYPVEAIFAPDVGGAPGIEKRWREVQLHFGQQCCDTLTVAFANERSATKAVTSTNSNFQFGVLDAPLRRVSVPQAVQMGTQLFVSIQMQEALSYFTLLGVSATAESVSERTGQ